MLFDKANICKVMNQDWLDKFTLQKIPQAANTRLSQTSEFLCSFLYELAFVLYCFIVIPVSCGAL